MDGYIDVDQSDPKIQLFYDVVHGDTVRDDVTSNTATVVLTQFTALQKLRIWIKRCIRSVYTRFQCRNKWNHLELVPNRTLGNIEQTNMAGLNGAGNF